ncbi:PLP-dependent lyase/thiolase [Burkholderia diffusa]|uniref:PLP-dependent lyase/thiolase n=1 Tax=Burkholderia diffusa TaxID=488732 RepID=A0AAW3PCM4_9BURK|nr:diaminopropionate ammonia-lyase [Burkholderia diffusa]KWF28499.1 PLP-dependent lyase/thiolase [Burkholderia diffusa]KWF36461.1 PLP-dependent lyase/thiolase [Burkholderia diffusa]KWF40620.1 PLP-dependent lyase/thiolase [Burkholderia diffusa]KWF50168.1 PLP-dependent lyase/thiolase [Burkholderia diffusa]
MLIANPRASRVDYPDALRRIMNIDAAGESGAWLSHWPLVGAARTPLRALPDLAARLGVASVGVKDEACRSPLGSFKALGAPIALMRLVKRLRRNEELDPRGLVTGRYAASLANLTVISATDGNHGRALAAAARAIGCRCVIVLHAHVDAEREHAIAAQGARIVRIAGNYDESVVHAAQLADANGWHVVSDTSYDGYEAIPRDVMQGYGVIAAEALAQQPACEDGRPFTHVFLQGGVGGLAAGVASYLWEHAGARRPHFIVVEPRQADCLYQSALAGRATKATGSVDSVMAGLACGEASPLAWDFLEPCIDHFMLIDDDDAVQAMRGLAAGSERDVPFVSGESGAAGIAGLTVLMRDPVLARQTGLDANARVLAINTEGATAPSVYRQCVGDTADAVLARQRDWLNRAAAMA